MARHQKTLATPDIRTRTWSVRPDACPALLSINEGCWRRFDPRWRVSLAHWALTGLLTPGYRVRIGDAAAPWRPQAPFTWHLYPPGSAFWEDSPDAAEPVKSLWLEFTGGERIGLDRLIPPGGTHAVFHDAAGRLVRHVQQMAATATALGEGGYWTVQMELLKVVVMLEKARPVRPGIYDLGDDGRPAADPLATRVQHYLKAHLQDRLSLAAVARHAGVSIPTLARRYKDATGETPMKTLARLRIERARDLLLAGQPLKDIAESLQFYDAFHLSKSFKQYEGCSPRAFLQNARRLPESRGLHVRS